MLRQSFEGLRGIILAAVAIATVLFFATVVLGQNTAAADPAAEFVEINAEIEILSWSGGPGGTAGPRSEYFPIHAVVGRNKWTLGNQIGQTNYYSFDGKQIVEHRLVGSGVPTDQNKTTDSDDWWTRSFDSPDGNPSETVRVGDHLDMVSRIAWLGFCSASTFDNPSHKLYPPWDFWKEYIDPSTFVEKPTRFEDDLGLPKSLVLFSGENQPVVDYRVSITTNVAGWLFPRSFFLLEYNPTGTKAWMLSLLAHGTVSSIIPTTDPLGSVKAITRRQSHVLRFAPVSPSKIHLEGTSDMYDWSLDSPQIVGFLELNQPLFDDATRQTSGLPPENLRAQGEFFLPVRHFTSGCSTPIFSNKPDQAVLHYALNTTDHPNIIYRLHQLTVPSTPQTAAGLVLQSTGEVVIRGITNSISMPIKATRQGDALRLSGSTVVKLSNYGIRPSSVQGMTWGEIGDTVEADFDLQLKQVQ